MKATIEKGLTGRSAEKGQELDALNKEVIPVVQKCREVLNYEHSFKVSASTQDSLGTYRRLWESEQAPTKGTWLIEARISASNEEGDAAGFVIVGIFRCIAGGISQIGSTNILVRERNNAGVNVQFGIDSTNRTVYVEGTDDGINEISFDGTVRVLDMVTG